MHSIHELQLTELYTTTILDMFLVGYAWFRKKKCRHLFDWIRMVSRMDHGTRPSDHEATNFWYEQSNAVVCVCAENGYHVLKWEGAVHKQFFFLRRMSDEVQQSR